MARNYSITLQKKKVKVIFTNRLPKDIYGDCDPPDTPKPEIRIREGLTEQRELEVLLHEMDHFCNWNLCENHIRITNRDRARVLRQMGYRRTGDAR